MQKLILLLSVLISVSAYANESFVISGTFPDNSNDGKHIYLKDIDAQYKEVILDSCVVENKTFTLKGSGTDMPSIGLISSADRSIQTMVILEPGKIFVSFPDMTSNGYAKMEGTPKNNELWNFINTQNRLTEQFSSTYNKPENEQAQMMDQIRESISNYVKANVGNRIGELMFMDAIKILNKKQVAELFAQMHPDFKDSETGFNIKSYISEKTFEVGDSYEDIKLTDPKGKEVSLSDYVGKNKVILIDFWASWCGPCRREMPHLIEAYERYNSKGFEIVGVSLDNNESAWKNFISSQKVAWPQMSDLKGWQSRAAQLYGVKSIPLTLLLDEKGNIIAKNLRGEQLSQKLEELLK